MPTKKTKPIGRKVHLNLSDPCYSSLHRSGIAGLALALSVLDPKDFPFRWDLTPESVYLEYDCNDEEALESLWKATVRLEEGLVVVPALKHTLTERQIYTDLLYGSFVNHSKKATKATVGTGAASRSDTRYVSAKLDDRTVCYSYCPLKTLPWADSFSSYSSGNSTPATWKTQASAIPGNVNNGFSEPTFGHWLALKFAFLSATLRKTLSFDSKGGCTSGVAVIIPDPVNLTSWVRTFNTAPKFPLDSVELRDEQEAVLEAALAVTENGLSHICGAEVYLLGKLPWGGKYQTASVIRHNTVILDEETPSKLGELSACFPKVYFAPKIDSPSDQSETEHKTAKKTDKQDKPITGRFSRSNFFRLFVRNVLEDKPLLTGLTEFYAQNFNPTYPITAQEKEALNMIATNQTETFGLTQQETEIFAIATTAWANMIRRERDRVQGGYDYGKFQNHTVAKIRNSRSREQLRTLLAGMIAATKGVDNAGLKLFGYCQKDYKATRDIFMFAILSYRSKASAEKDSSETGATNAE